MFLRRKKLSLTSNAVTRKETPVWIRRNQNFYRLKRNGKNSAPVRRRSSLY